MEWRFLTPELPQVQSIQKTFRISEVMARVLLNRHIHTQSEADLFFHPDWTLLHDPFLMKDMTRAVDRILINILEHKPVLILGDFDVDGTTGVASLYLALKQFGGKVETYIPNREREGYGLSLKGIEYAQTIGADLFITCDCGINAVSQVEFANEKSIDIIITDHHTPPATLPEAFAILNPKQLDCPYPFKGLCGGGVALKFIMAIGEKLHIPFEQYQEILPLITLGTAADIVPMMDENRIIVSTGLSLMGRRKQPGLKQLLNLAGLTKNYTVGQLVFNVAPKINAAGRLGDGNRAVALLVTDDEEKAKELARELDEENKRRQGIQETVVREAFLTVNAEADLSKDHALVLASEGWHHGVVGIVASKLKESFHRPTIVIAIQNGLGKGSARSINGFDLTKALEKCQEYLEGFGGHPLAAGLTVKPENIARFKEAFLTLANQSLSKEDLKQTITLECLITFQDITPRFMKFLDKLGPYGPGNMRPKFAITGGEIVGVPKVIGKTGDHLRFKVRQGQRSYPAVGFGLSAQYEMLITGKPVDMAFVIETNEWQGNTSIQLNVRDIKPTATG